LDIFQEKKEVKYGMEVFILEKKWVSIKNF
jgi:hypothetical protein